MPLSGFISKPAEKVQDLLKNCTRNYFQNIYPFEKSACFYATITENHSESNFLKIENHFQKAGIMFLVKIAKIENVIFW